MFINTDLLIQRKQLPNISYTRSLIKYFVVKINNNSSKKCRSTIMSHFESLH